MEKELAQVPYIVYESGMIRMERMTRNLVIALVVTIILMFASNAVWLYAWMQYDYSSEATTTETVTVDGKDGVANYNHIDGDGEITNGESNGETSYEEEQGKDEDE